MPGPAYVTRADLQAQFTPDQVARAFSDDGGATFNQSAFDSAVARASRVADSILAKAWTDPAQRALIAADDGVKGMIAVLAMHFGTSRRPEYISQEMPNGPMAAAAKEARQDLEAIAAGEMEPSYAAGAATNTVAVGSLHNPSAVRGGPDRFFSPTRAKPNPGGF